LRYNLQADFYAKYLLAIFSIAGGYLALVFLDTYSGHQHYTTCAFKLTTGIPCPGCGMGRATLALMKGDVALCFYYNILCIPFTLAIFVSLIWLLADIINGEETFFHFIKRDIKMPYKLLLVALVVIDWAINIIRQI
jgi:hypothetical protein